MEYVIIWREIKEEQYATKLQEGRRRLRKDNRGREKKREEEI